MRLDKIHLHLLLCILRQMFWIYCLTLQHIHIL
jgi:hypothetical protein